MCCLFVSLVLFSFGVCGLGLFGVRACRFVVLVACLLACSLVCLCGWVGRGFIGQWRSSGAKVRGLGFV